MKLFTRSVAMFTMLAMALPLMAQEEEMGLHQTLRDKFIEGNTGFMSLVAAALINRPCLLH